MYKSEKTCKGSISLGTGCRMCSKCKDELAYLNSNKNTKVINLKRFESTCKKGIFIDESYYAKYTFNEKYTQYARAVRTTNGNIETRTHNVELNDKTLWYENNTDSNGRTYVFSSNEKAIEWWNANIKTKIVYKNTEDSD